MSSLSPRSNAGRRFFCAISVKPSSRMAGTTMDQAA